jgi:quinol monooxygenase YgiN
VSTIAIIVEYEAKPEYRTELEATVRQNAAETLLEPGCLRMEVLIPKNDGGRIILNELWRDEQALEDHKSQPGHDEGHRAYAHMIAAKRVVVCDIA